MPLSARPKLFVLTNPQDWQKMNALEKNGLAPQAGMPRSNTANAATDMSFQLTIRIETLRLITAKEMT